MKVDPVVTALHQPATWRRWAPRLDQARRALWAQASGRVLQIGEAGSLGVAAGRPGPVLDVESRRRWPPVRLSNGEDTFDTVVTVMALCRVADLDETVRDLRHLLSPGGRLLFCEHVAATGAGGSLQLRLAPAWARATGGCHLGRDILGALRRGGFTIASCEKPAAAGVRSLFPVALGVGVPTLDTVTG